MARKRQVKKGFRRGERKHAPEVLSARIQEEARKHPVVVRLATPEELERIRQRRPKAG